MLSLFELWLFDLDLHQEALWLDCWDCFLQSLIRIKDRIRRFGILPRNPKEVAMPFDSILVSAAVVSVFAVFAGVLIWVDFHSQPMRQGPANQITKRRSF
jgi:hypothetical protein